MSRFLRDGIYSRRQIHLLREPVKGRGIQIQRINQWMDRIVREADVHFKNRDIAAVEIRGGQVVRGVRHAEYLIARDTARFEELRHPRR